MKKKIKKHIKSLKVLKDEAWAKISVYVRSLGAKGEWNQCYTCLCWFKWKTQMDCGHYIHNRLDYELNNLKPQCKRCNKWLHGNLAIYGERLIEEIGILNKPLVSLTGRSDAHKLLKSPGRQEGIKLESYKNPSLTNTSSSGLEITP